jgi:glycosyltransferase involved in cell wall biosynthesis
VLRDVLIAERYPGPYFVVPQSVPVNEFRPEDARTGPRRPPVVGIVGPFEISLKGVPVALRAVRRLRETGREILLHRASQVPLTAEEHALAPSQRYDVCVAAGRMPAWYHELDLLLFASEPGEGFGLPPLEAMAAGVPAVVTEIPSLRILPSDAVVRVKVGDDAALAREAARLLDDGALWDARRKRGLEAASRFTLGPVLDRLEEIFGQKLS